MQAAKWIKDKDDPRGKWALGSTGWVIFKMADAHYRAYAPNKQFKPALTLEGAKAFAEAGHAQGVVSTAEVRL